MTIQGFSERFKNELEDYTRKNNISNKEFARRVGVERKAIYKWISGQHLPNALALARVCAVLNVSADYLLGLKEE